MDDEDAASLNHSMDLIHTTLLERVAIQLIDH